MSERIPAVLKIGGPIPRNKFRDLLQAIEDQGTMVYLEGDGKEDTEDLMKSLQGRYISVHDAQASYGLFVELEQFLQTNNISFDRHSSPSDTYDAEIVSFRQGEIRYFNATKDGQKLVPAEPFEKVKEVLDSKGVAGLLDLIKRLQDVPELKPIRFV